MQKGNVLDRLKKFFIEEPKNKINKKVYTIQKNTVSNEEEKTNKQNNYELKKLIDEIIEENNDKKEDIIKALKQCERLYYDDEKQLEIMQSIGDLQNDPEILATFIDETVKYSRFDGNTHYNIRKARVEAIKKLNKIKLKEILKCQNNTYNDKKNIIKVLNAIKNEQILFKTKETQKNSIIKVYNNINDGLYDDIQILEVLFQVFDNKIGDNESEELTKIINKIKKKVNLYYNIEGTKEDKINAIKQIPLEKIKEIANEENEQMLDDLNNENEYKPEKNEIETKEKISNNYLHSEYKPVDYTAILESQEERIKNANNKTVEEKKKLIEELYRDFETFVGETSTNTKTR